MFCSETEPEIRQGLWEPLKKQHPWVMTVFHEKRTGTLSAETAGISLYVKRVSNPLYVKMRIAASIAVTFKAKISLRYMITAGCGPNGSISPSGEVIVAQGENMTFSITPDPGYQTDEVLMDGKEVRLGDDSTFTFINVSRDYALYVTFKAKGLQ